MEVAAIAIGIMVAITVVIIKMHAVLEERKFETMKAMALADIQKRIARNRYNREHPMPATTTPEQDEIILATLESIKKKREQKAQCESQGSV